MTGCAHRRRILLNPRLRVHPVRDRRPAQPARGDRDPVGHRLLFRRGIPRNGLWWQPARMGPALFWPLTLTRWPCTTLDGTAPRGTKLQRCRAAFSITCQVRPKRLIAGEGNGRFLVECRRKLRLRKSRLGTQRPYGSPRRAPELEPQDGLARVQFVPTADALTLEPESASHVSSSRISSLDCFRPLHWSCRTSPPAVPPPVAAMAASPVFRCRSCRAGIVRFPSTPRCTRFCRCRAPSSPRAGSSRLIIF